MRTLKFMAGMLVGALCGAIVVLLITPQSGEDTQLMMTEKMNTLRGEAKKAFDTRKMSLEKQIADLQAG